MLSAGNDPVGVILLKTSESQPFNRVIWQNFVIWVENRPKKAEIDRERQRDRETGGQSYNEKK